MPREAAQVSHAVRLCCSRWELGPQWWQIGTDEEVLIFGKQVSTRLRSPASHRRRESRSRTAPIGAARSRPETAHLWDKEPLPLPLGLPKREPRVVKALTFISSSLLLHLLWLSKGSSTAAWKRSSDGASNAYPAGSLFYLQSMFARADCSASSKLDASFAGLRR